MIEINASVVGALWLYASYEADGSRVEEVIVDELRPAVDTPDESNINLQTRVNLVVTLECDEVYYKMRIQDITLGVARDITDDLITSQSVIAYFESDGSISQLLSRLAPYRVTDSQMIGLSSGMDSNEE
jgi:hypothetical protein